MDLRSCRIAESRLAKMKEAQDEQTMQAEQAIEEFKSQVRFLGVFFCLTAPERGGGEGGREREREGGREGREGGRDGGREEGREVERERRKTSTYFLRWSSSPVRCSPAYTRSWGDWAMNWPSAAPRETAVSSSWPDRDRGKERRWTHRFVCVCVYVCVRRASVAILVNTYCRGKENEK